MNNGHEFCFRDDICPLKKPDDCMKCELYCPKPVWMRYTNPETAAKPQFRRFKGAVTQYYRPEFTVEEPDFGPNFGKVFENYRRAVMEQQVKAIDTLDQKMVEACIQAAQEEGVCLTLIDKKFIADAIREKMEREGLMDEQLTTGDDD